MTASMRNTFFWFYVITTAISLAILMVLIGAESYIRWAVNQDFSFLPGAGFEALTVLVLGELLGLAYLLKE